MERVNTQLSLACQTHRAATRFRFVGGAHLIPRRPPGRLWLKMYLMMYINEAGKVVYTLKARVGNCALRCHAHGRSRVRVPALTRFPRRSRPQKTGPDGKPTQSAHPARFSPDDKFSRVRALAQQHALLLLQQQLTRFHTGARHLQEALQPAADAEARCAHVSAACVTAAQPPRV